MAKSTAARVTRARNLGRTAGGRIAKTCGAYVQGLLDDQPYAEALDRLAGPPRSRAYAIRQESLVSPPGGDHEDEAAQAPADHASPQARLGEREDG